MKTSNRLAIIGALSLALAAVSGYAQTDQQAPDGQRPGVRRPGPPKELIDKYDVNKDGRLDEQEHAALRKDIEDGKIAAAAASARARGDGRPGRTWPRHDAVGEGHY